MAVGNNLNRLKVVFCEKKRTGKWLAQQLGVNLTTVFELCSNTSHLDLYTIAKIADLQQVDKGNRYNLQIKRIYGTSNRLYHSIFRWRS